MSHTPDTWHQLLLRLRDSADSVAWQEFKAIYQPVIHTSGGRGTD